VRAEEGAGPQVKGSLMCIDWKSKEKKRKKKHFRETAQDFIKKETYLHKCKTL
jgi:hypothetical protein